MERIKIAIVDDDLDLTKALQATLESEQYTVVTASNRAEGMETIRREKPDLAIVDVMMVTWQDGFEMARELKVSYFVEGSGQKIGDQILLNIQLIEAESDGHLWAEQYRRETGDIFLLQAVACGCAFISSLDPASLA